MIEDAWEVFPQVDWKEASPENHEKALRKEWEAVLDKPFIAYDKKTGKKISLKGRVVDDGPEHWLQARRTITKQQLAEQFPRITRDDNNVTWPKLIGEQPGDWE